MSLSCHQQNPEQRLFDCWNNSFQSKGLDLKNEIKRFEDNLIENGYLKDTTWSSYKRLIDSLGNSKSPAIFRTIDLDNFYANSDFVISNCSDLTSNAKIDKLSKISEDLINATKNNNGGFNNIYKQISSDFNEKDFQSDLYKTWISWFLISNSINPNKLKEILPKSDSSIKYSMTIKIDNQCDYYINGVKTDFDKIEIQIKDFDLQTNSIIGLDIDKTIPLNKTIEIMNICKRQDLKTEILTND